MGESLSILILCLEKSSKDILVSHCNPIGNLIISIPSLSVLLRLSINLSGIHFEFIFVLGKASGPGWCPDFVLK